VQSHPLEGQASYLANGALTYASRSGGLESAILVSTVGTRLSEVGIGGLANVLERPVTTLDATLNFGTRHLRTKWSAENLLDTKVQVTQGPKEVSAYRSGRVFTIAVRYEH
jgi:hypothetical protein